MAKALAAQAVIQLDHDPELGVLLAMEAVSVTRRVGEEPVASAEDALHAALLRSPLRGVLGQQIGAVFGVRYSPDGKYVLTVGEDSIARVWDVDALTGSGRPRFVLTGTPGSSVDAIYSPDGGRILTIGGTGTSRVWDATTGRLRFILQGSSSATIGMATWSPDGTRILIAGGPAGLRVWDAASGQLLPRPTSWRGLGGADSVVWSPDGTRILTRSGPNVQIWDVASGEERLNINIPKGETTSSLGIAVYSPDGRNIATAGLSEPLHVWDAITGKARFATATLAGWVHDVAWSRDSHFLITAATAVPNDVVRDNMAAENTAEIWDATTGQLYRTLYSSAGGFFGVAWSPDGSRIVSAGNDGTVKLWAPFALEELPTLQGPIGLSSATYCSAGDRIVTGGLDNQVRVWHAATGRLLLTLPLTADAGYSVRPLACSPDGTRIAASGFDTSSRNAEDLVKIWDVVTGQELLVLHLHIQGISSIAYSPDGARIMTTSETGGVQVWDAGGSSGTMQPRLALHDTAQPLAGAVFSPDGRQIASVGGIPMGGLHNCLQISDAISGRPLASYNEPSLQSAAYSPDGRFLVTASVVPQLDPAGVAQVRDATSGAVRFVLRAPSIIAHSVAFSLDGTRIVTANDDGSVRLWDATTGAEQVRLAGHTGAVYSATFSPDGSRIVTAGHDGTARQYLVRVENLLALAAPRVSRTLTPAERATFLGELPPTPAPAPSPPLAAPNP